MSDQPTRRTVLASSAAAFAVPLARAASDGKLRAGLIGCGGRGSQAVTDLLTGTENVELVAMADVFEDKLEGSLKRLREGAGLRRYENITVPRGGKPKTMTLDDLMKEIPARIQVPPENHFTGFDAFKKVINSDVDIVMLCTPPGYRPMHFEAAIDAGKHVFTEKPIATDPVGCRRFMAAGEESRREETHRCLRRPAPRPSRIPGDCRQDQGRRHRRHPCPLLPLPLRPRFPRPGPRPQVGRHGMAAPQLVFLRLDLRRPDRRAALSTTSTSSTGSWARTRSRSSPPAASPGARATNSTATSTTTWLGLRVPQRHPLFVTLPPVSRAAAPTTYAT